MSYAEFPSTFLHLEDGDHHELIEFYLEVREKYTGTLEAIKKLDDELKQYRADMQREISSSVELAVTKQLDQSLNEISAELRNIWSDIHLTSAEITQLKSVDDSLLKELERLESEIIATDKKIFQLRVEFDNKLTKLQSDTEKSISSLDEKTQAEFSTIAEKIVADDSKTLSKAQGYAYRLNVATKKDIQQQISEIEATASSEAIQWIWEYGCCHGGFTAEEWYHLTNICNIAWGEISPSAWEWYTMGKSLFRKFRRKNKMYSPVSGRYVDAKTAIMELAYKLDVWNLTAEEYDAFGFTAEEYDNFKLTAEEYDWNGKEKLDVQQGD